jgi:hypothetical protein
LPADDRRHYIAWSDLKKEKFDQRYWQKMWRWYEGGGKKHVAAYLREYDISKFDPKAPPPKTAAFWEIVDAGQPPEHAELSGVLEAMGEPIVTTIDDIAALADDDFREYLTDRKNRRTIRHRLEDCGYTAVRNQKRDDGLWRISNKPKVIYGRADRSQNERLQAAEEFIGEREAEARRWRKGPG